MFKTGLSMLVNNFDIIFMFMGYYMLINITIQNYGVHTMELFDLCILIWSILSLVLKTDQKMLLRNFAINLVFPIFILCIIITRYIQNAAIMNASFLKPVKSFFFERFDFTEEYINSYFRDHLITFVPIFCYTVAQTLRSSRKSDKNKNLLGKLGLKHLENKRGGNYGFLSLGLKLIGQLIVSFSRYISIIIGIAASLVSISFPNSICLLLSLFLLAVKKYDTHLWMFYMYYSIVICLLMYTNHKLPYSVESFNIEVLAALGLTKKTDICKLSLTKSLYSFHSVFFPHTLHRCTTGTSMRFL